MSLTFRSNNGTVWPLDGTTGVRHTGQDDGIFNAPKDLVVQQRVTSDGGVLANARRSPRSVTIEVMLEEQPGVTLLKLWGNLNAALDAGGTLEYNGPNGVRTLKNVVLEASGRSMTGYDLKTRTVDVFPLSLLALDPWWYGPPQSTPSTLINAALTDFDAAVGFDAATPFDGGGSLVIVVDGHAPASPRFLLSGTITGPAPHFTATNGTNTWQLIAPLAVQAFELDTRPGSRGPHYGSSLLVNFPAQEIDWSLLSESSRLFDLPVGTTTVTFLSNGAAGFTGFLISWETRWLTP